MPGETVRRALAGVEQLYTGNLTEHGAGAQSVGWRDEDSQELRFRKLAYVVDAAVGPDRGVTVADLGCGYGAMFRFLDDLLGPRLARYVGYDLSQEMLDTARQTIDDPRATWVHGGELQEDCDLAFVSGTFNVRLEAPEEEWRGFIHDTLRQLASHSRLGIAFNLLTSYVDWREDHLFYGDPHEFFDFCRRELSPRVTLLHDYPLWEWTMAVVLERRS